MKTKMRMPEDFGAWYIQQIEENRKIYDDIVKTHLNYDIELVSKDIFDAHAGKDSLKAFFQSNYYKNRWFDINYRIRVAWIMLTYEFWEQQLKSFLFFITEQAGAKKPDLKYFNNCISCIKDITDGVDVTKFLSYDVIKEMRLLVNVIKHAEGNSFDELNKMRPDLFVREKDPVDGSDIPDALQINKIYTSIYGRTINITDDDYYKYCDGLKLFWEEMLSVRFFPYEDSHKTRDDCLGVVKTDIPI